MKSTQNTIKKNSKTAKRSYTLDDLLDLTRKRGRVNDKTPPDNFGEKLAEKALERIRKQELV